MSPENINVSHREKFLNKLTEAEDLASEFNIPRDDILLIALNLSGIQYRKIKNDRGRFSLKLPSGRSFKLATTITDSSYTNFIHNGKNVFLGDEIIGLATEVEKDNCTDSYWRNRMHLTLNSNSRSICKGCLFCGTYNLEKQDVPLTHEENLQKRSLEFLKEVDNFSGVDAIGMVTGCFGSEKQVVDHIKLIRRVFSRIGFKGEIQYVGSQIRSEKAIRQLVEDGPFALYLTLEVFTEREKLMKKQKSSLELDEARKILETAKDLGAQSSFLYIAGIDPFPVIERELPRFAEVVTRFPQLQTYQLYTPDQIIYRNTEAKSLEYYLKIRKLAEEVWPNLRPITFHNYRGLWFTEYRGETI